MWPGVALRSIGFPLPRVLGETRARAEWWLGGIVYLPEKVVGATKIEPVTYIV
jgi:hypothetical protein